MRPCARGRPSSHPRGAMVENLAPDLSPGDTRATRLLYASERPGDYLVRAMKYGGACRTIACGVRAN